MIITGDDVHVDGKRRFLNWGDARHSDMQGKIVSVDFKYKGNVELESGQMFENGVALGEQKGYGPTGIGVAKADLTAYQQDPAQQLYQHFQQPIDGVCMH